MPALAGVERRKGAMAAAVVALVRNCLLLLQFMLLLSSSASSFGDRNKRSVCVLLFVMAAVDGWKLVAMVANAMVAKNRLIGEGIAMVFEFEVRFYLYGEC